MTDDVTGQYLVVLLISNGESFFVFDLSFRLSYSSMRMFFVFAHMRARAVMLFELSRSFDGFFFLATSV